MQVRREITERTLAAAEYILKTGDTVRGCAKQFGVSKTTIHKDMRERLPDLNLSLADAVGEVLAHNREERHIRGGEATRRKYRKKTEQN